MKHAPLTFEYSAITPSIYIGTNMCCQTHFASSLLKKGINADISLEEKKLDNPFGVAYYLWLPTKDHTPLHRKQLEVGVDFLQSLMKNNIKVYVHCQRGHGRAPSLVAAYLISTGRSVAEAIQFIKQRRPSIHLDKTQAASLRKFAGGYA